MATKTQAQSQAEAVSVDADEIENALADCADLTPDEYESIYEYLERARRAISLAWEVSAKIRVA
jgi:hypothetical protein